MSLNISTDKDTHVNTTMEYLDEGFHVRPEFWGRDHWSTFAYALCCVRKARLNDKREEGFDGWVKRPQMRANPARHRALQWKPSWRPESEDTKPKYPTRLKAGIQVLWHDDWDCLRDLEAYGLLKVQANSGHVEITEAGVDVAAQMFLQVSTVQPETENIFLASAGAWDGFNSRDKVKGTGFCWSDLKVEIPGYVPG